MQKLLPLFAFTTMVLCIPQQKFSTVALGSHAPKQATFVWQTIAKSGARASACPVKLDKERSRVWWLTAAHVVEGLTNDSIVQDVTKQRKLKVVHKEVHPNRGLDLGFIVTEHDGKKLDLFQIEVGIDLDAGLSAFSTGFEGISSMRVISRGYLGPLNTFQGHEGMSGGGVLLNDGRLVGILTAHLGRMVQVPTFDKTHKLTGYALIKDRRRGLCNYADLRVAKAWLILKKLVK